MNCDPVGDVESTGDRCGKHRRSMWTAPEIDVAKGGGDVSKGEHDVESTGDRCGCSRILMETVMEGDVKAAGGFPLEAEDDVAAVEKDVGAAVGGPNPQGDSIRESEEIFTAKTPRMI